MDSKPALSLVAAHQLGLHSGSRAVHYGDMQLTHPTQSKCSFCFFNVTMFISFQLPLCELEQLNLSNFPGGSHSKSLLRVSSSDRSVLGVPEFRQSEKDWLDNSLLEDNRRFSLY